MLSYSSVILLLLASFTILDVVSSHPGYVDSENLSNIGNESYLGKISPLGELKLGLTAAFFFGVLLACGLPIIAIDCLRKQASANQFERPSNSTFDSNPSSSRIDEEEDNEQVTNHTSVSDQSYPNSNRVDDPSTQKYNTNNTNLPNSPFCPSPHSAETTELLGGQQFSPADWNQARQSGNAASRTAAAAFNKSNRSGRCPPCLFSRSALDRKHLLRRWFSRCNCFAAGIFLSSGLMELFVDVEVAINTAKEHLGLETDFPFASFLTLIGFFLVLSIEQIVLTCRRPYSVRRGHSHSSPRRITFPSVTPLSENRSHPAPTPDRPTSTDHFNFNESVIGTHESRTDPHNPDRSVYTDAPSIQHATTQNVHHHHHHFTTHERLDSFSSVLRVMLLLCAMSVHSLFEGLAVGLQLTTRNTLALFSAILLHKLIIAAGIGVNLATTFTPNRSSSRYNSNKALWHQLVPTLILASSSPIGLLIGWALMRQQQSGVLLMTTAALQGLACGTFLFVVFCELLPEEFREGKGDRLSKLTFLILGFALVSLYSFLMPH